MEAMAGLISFVRSISTGGSAIFTENLDSFWKARSIVQKGREF